MNLLHRSRAVGVLLVALALMGAPAAHALEDATAFGFNSMRTVGMRPLLVVLLRDTTMPGGLAHDPTYYDRLVFGPLSGGAVATPNVFAYFAENSNGHFIWTRAGVVGPLSMNLSTASDDTIRRLGVQAAGDSGGVDYGRFDRNEDGKVTADELGVLVISNRGDAQTAFHTMSVRGKSVSVGASSLGHRQNLMTLCHELAHQLGALDLYGRWGLDCLNTGLTLMGCTGGAADGLESFHLDAWHKVQLGWARPQVRDLRAGGSSSLVAQQIPTIRAPADKGPLLLYDSTRGTREFFLLEHRSRTAGGGRSDANVASTGLAIWHVVQDGNKRPILVPHANAPNAQVFGVFNRGAPNWVWAGTTLYTSNTSPALMRWLDGSDTFAELRVGAPSSDGALLPVSWTSRPLADLYWHPWAALNGGYALGRPAVGTNADGRLEVFIRGLDNALWQIWQVAPNGAWSGWNSLGGILTSEPAVGRNRDGRLEVFARGTDGRLWQRWQTFPNLSWAGWGNGLNTIQFQGNPVVASNQDGRLEVFVRAGLRGTVWHTWQTAPNNGWAPAWEDLGTPILGDPAVGRNADGRLELFVRASGGQLGHIWQTRPNGPWSSWARESDGSVSGQPVVAANADGRLEVFFRGFDRTGYGRGLLHTWQPRPSSGPWSGWAQMGGLPQGDPAVSLNRLGALEVFVRSDDGALWHTYQTGATWTAWQSLGKPSVAASIADHAVAREADGRLHVVVRMADGALWYRRQR
jgi:M6 family metalloprotease-like protein